MRLTLERPLVIFDVETTGTDPMADRIIEIALVKIRPDGGRDLLERRVHPGMPIPAGSTAIHGITDADVADLPPFGAIAAEVAAFVEGCDLGGYNAIKFDIPVLQAELRRAGLDLTLAGRALVDPQRIFFLKEPRDLSAALRLYCGRDLVGAHGALADAEATVDVLLGQLERYPDLPVTPAGISDLLSEGLLDPEGKLRWRDGEAVIGFGKNRGQTLREISERTPEYLRWMISASFSDEVKSIARDALNGKFPERKNGA